MSLVGARAIRHQNQVVFIIIIVVSTTLLILKVCRTHTCMNLLGTITFLAKKFLATQH